jgi:2'-5' RNA ligase
MAVKQFATLVWLIPEPRSQTPLDLLITDLARRYDAAVFEPHLTLGRITGASPGSIKIDRRPISLEVIGVFTSDDFTKTLFLRFASTPALEEFRFSLGMTKSGYDPHLSLLYSKMPEGEGQRLATSIRFPKSEVVFDRFSVVRCVNPTTTKEDVESWKQLSSGALSGA